MGPGDTEPCAWSPPAAVEAGLPTDGGVETIGTDERWRAHRTPITASDLHDGESYDARTSSWGDAGALVDLPRRTVAGLAPAEPSCRRMRVAPQPGRGLTSAYAAQETPYGRAEVAWERNGAVLTVRVLVPPNSTAVVELPELDDPFEIGSGEHSFLAGCRAPEEDTRSEPTALNRALALHTTQRQALQQ